ncbi:transglycosylase domain-containing protein [Corynebacterium variabile]|uniref:transglycosylase domain-containing protein n=1 Tax=Corynebacterium variabile TaxID=1727 RepID=UPI0028AB9D3E|nr:transglycosylase domain-containing protein [Corynebacterium variabile]
MTNDNSSNEDVNGAAASSGDAGDNLRVRTRRRRPRWRRVITTVCSVIAVLIIVPLVAFFAAYAVTKVPQPEELQNNQISNIYAADGSSELAHIVPPEGNRENVDINEVPEHVRNAVLSAEDRDFYSNSGFSVTGFGRAAIGQLTGNDSAGGGSTITQQYVKNAVVGDERSLVRKGKELVISAKMTREWSKDEILEAYLNTIYFGRNAYGISAAAKAYFNKPVQELTVEEGAVLAASIQRPSQLDPWTNRPEAEDRWNYVMDGLVGLYSIDRNQRSAAVYPETIDPATVDQGSIAEGTNGLIKSQVLAELAANGISEEAVNTGGLKITTTIDSAKQQSMVDAVHSRLDSYGDDVRSAGVSVNPKTGGVEAYYGGDDPNGFDWANAGLQTGSTFKIVTLAAAVEQGIPTSAMYDSSPVTSGDNTVTNDSGETCGTCSLAQALKMSLNTSFIRLTQSLDNGAQDVADMAHKLGAAESIPGIDQTLTENGETPYEGITLGQYQSRPLDMASILATLSNRGKYIPPHFVEKVETQSGEVLLDNSEMEGTQVINPDTADAVISAMGPIAGYSNNHDLAGRQSAAKTGTAQLGDTGQNKDAWMIGSTPQLATAVWMGNVNGQPLVDMTYGGPMYGSKSPADIWKNFMDAALVNEPAENFKGGVAADTSTGGGGGGWTGGYESTPQEDTQEGPAEEAPAPQDNGGGTGEGGGELPDVGQMIEDFLNGGN